jgi:hypothetical protein
MKYEVFTADTLTYYISNNIIQGDHDQYYADQLGAFDEVHVTEFCSNILAELGLNPKVVLDLTWVKDLNNPNTEKRLTKLIGYLERYSSTYNEALNIHNRMVACNIKPNKCFFEYYVEMLSFLGNKMQIS